MKDTIKIVRRSATECEKIFAKHTSDERYIQNIQETSLVVQWLKLHAPSARYVGLIPGWGTKIHVPERANKTNKQKIINQK